MRSDRELPLLETAFDDAAIELLRCDGLLALLLRVREVPETGNAPENHVESLGPQPA